MPASSAERRRLLKQAIAGYAQRHPDCDINGIEFHLADAIGLTIASIKKWRTGYPVSEKHVPALAEWAVRQAGMDRAWLRSFLHHCALVDDELEDRLCGLSGEPTLSALRIVADAANLRLWGRPRLASATSMHYPRPALQDLIQCFLASDRPGLILVGASGLGKTSLALWLTSIQAHLPLPVLVYPAAILDGSQPLADLLRSTLYPQSASTGSPLTWPILAIFDGVNESPEMLRLAWQIDRALVDTRGLKVLLTFRPESFQIARQRLALNEHCYFANPVEAVSAPDKSSPQVLTFNPPAVQLLPFTPDELPAAYDLYQRTHTLQTAYTGMPASLREILRYPLNLRLVAEAYAGASLPDQVDAGELVQRMLEAFVANGRLQQSDIYLLEDNLMPLMISRGYWSNIITAKQIEIARTPDGQRLIARGEPGPLTRLADVGLLASTNGQIDEPIRFAHERFYEHFAGRCLRRLRAEATDVRVFYNELATSPIFVYGPARRLLADEIAQQPISWLVDWLAGGSQFERDRLLIGALEDWGKANPQTAHVELEHLWQTSQSRVSRWIARVGLPVPEPNPRSLRLQQVVVAVAGALHDRELLNNALLGSNQAVQSAAVAQVLHLWRSDPKLGKRMVIHVSQHITGRIGLLNWTAGLAFVQLMGFILFEFSQEDGVQTFLYAQGQFAVRRVFGKFWRTLLLRAAIDWLVRMAERAIVDAALDSALEPGFHLSLDQRKHLDALVPFLDWETSGIGSAETYKHIRATMAMGVQVADWLLNILFVQRGLLRQPEIIAMIVTLLSEACETHPLPPWASQVVGFAIEVTRRQPQSDPFFWAALDTCVSRIVGDYPNWHERYRLSRVRPPQRLLNSGHHAGPYLMARHAAEMPLEESTAWAIIIQKIESGEATFIQDYLHGLRFVALDCKQPRLALRIMQPVLACPDKSIWPDTADLLAHIKLIAAEDVRDLLDSSMVQPELAALVQAWQTKDRTTERLFYTPWDWFYQFLIESRSARHLAVEAFGQVTCATSMRDWALWIAKRVLNALAEEEIFT